MGAVVTGNKIEFTANPSLPYTYRGVTWTSPSANHFHASGTASGNSLLYFHNQFAMPTWLQFDTQYNVYFPKTGTTNNVVFGVELQRNSDLSWYTAYFNYRASGTFTVPTEAQGYRQIIVYVRLSNGYTADETVYPYLIKTVPFTPRLSEFSPTRMRNPNNPYWYSNMNLYYSNGFGLPNCTCYAYGRWIEIMGGTVPTSDLGSGNGKDWFPNTNSNGIYPKISASDPNCQPRLGAIMCFAGGRRGLGHVAVVEQIDADGTVWTSNSAYQNQSLYFYLRHGKRSNNYGHYDGYVPYRFQGFIYLPDEYSPTPSPEPTPEHAPKKPYWFYLGRWPF